MIRVLASLLLIAAAGLPVSAAGTERPNVLFILTEDQGAHLSLLGTPGLNTPNMDRLAGRGVYFREAFVAYPVCSASKAAIYTGLHNHTNGLLGNTLNYFMPASQLTEQQRSHKLYRTNRIHARYPTLVEILHAEGYYTGTTHKLHVLPNEKFPYDEFLRTADPEEAVSGFIGRAEEKGKPWFLLLNIQAPHRPFRNSDTTPIGVDADEVDPPDFLPDTPVVRKDWAEYLDYVEVADEAVGRGLAALADSGAEDQTCVIFMGDHGPAFQRGKMSLYDLGLRVPLAIQGPGIAEGLVSDALASELDLLPTILDLLDVEAPTQKHGVSLAPILHAEPQAKGHDFVFAEIAHPFQTRDDGMQERSVYDGRYHLIYRRGIGKPRVVNADIRDWKPWRNRTYDETVKRQADFPLQYEMLRRSDPQRLGGKPLRLELYDTRRDPDEMTDLVGDPAHRPALDRLCQALRDWVRATGDPYVDADDVTAR